MTKKARYVPRAARANATQASHRPFAPATGSAGPRTTGAGAGVTQPWAGAPRVLVAGAAGAWGAAADGAARGSWAGVHNVCLSGGAGRWVRGRQSGAVAAAFGGGRGA